MCWRAWPAWCPWTLAQHLVCWEACTQISRTCLVLWTLTAVSMWACRLTALLLRTVTTGALRRTVEWEGSRGQVYHWVAPMVRSEPLLRVANWPRSPDLGCRHFAWMALRVILWSYWHREVVWGGREPAVIGRPDIRARYA